MLLYANLSSAQQDKTTVNKIIQNKWITETVEHLKATDSLQLLQLTEPQINSTAEYKRISYRIIKQGRIQCSGGESVYITLHSAHDNKEIGDVCIGLSDRGKIFVNFDHVCGGVINFKDNSATLPKDASDFFDRFVSDIDQEKWVIWK
jgi:hypothetical protein